ncbi:monovalent cation/H+ antiporter complex subunit F [Caldisalinibacter kiritimatiensis]|uniref:Multiple resistance and pH regulation protein F n=1 Tax=Caldisalinibacter kiritimatiensis TaxID=1304284 RepID=R1CZ59_9FIRM|nr:monovalent cation/H+ antiporter complex subunit F [Caldisalinibacter kiritimatiensis]EOD01864.1 Multiple resistance and pH regulation protein F [Caldisalinibacter kiritimatiensis]
MFLIITMVLLVIAMLVTVIRMVIGPTVWDRLLALNLISAKTILLLAVYGVYMENTLLLDISISYGIIGFIGITLLSGFIQRGGRLK